LFDRALDLTGLGEAMNGVFGEHQIAIDANVEHSVLASDQLGIDTKALLE